MSVLFTALVALAPQTSQLPQRPWVSQAPSGSPNIVLVVADDFGVDLVGAYGEGSSPPCTPTIDALASGGMLFRNAWANPTCSPTRAALLTGRYGFRTGIGSPLTNMEPGLPPSEITVPTMLAGYDSTCVGKWHLGGNLGPLHPNLVGFANFAGSLPGQVQSYSQWTKNVNGQPQPSMTYATTDTANGAITAIQTMSPPWFLMVSFNAPHTPYHEPPASVCAPRACGEVWCGNLPFNPTNRELGKAMVEAMDAELGRVIAALDAVDPDAWVFFLGDNGTAAQMAEPPYAPNKVKGTPYEGGLNVPLIVRGPTVAAGAECAGLVGVTDLFATFAELAGVPSTAEDSVSIVPYFSAPSLSLRDTVYSESFVQNGGPPFGVHRRAVRNARYKLIRQTGAPDELYDLALDPFETANLLPNLSAVEQAAFDALEAELVALGVD